MYKAIVTITFKQSILDPQGKTAQHALNNLGLDSIEKVRMGKHIEININANDTDEAYKTADEACKKLLANAVMEEYSIEIEEASVNA